MGKSLVIKAILFDLDGVLVDACDLHANAFIKSVKEYSGIVITKQCHDEEYNGLPTKIKLEKLKFSKEDSIEIEKLKQKYTKELINQNIHFDDDKIDLLNYIRLKNKKIIVVTNSIRSSAEMLLRHSGLYPFVNKLISNQDTNNTKPHPEGYIRGMIWANSYPDECLIVEDSDKGMEAARLTGANILRVKNPTEVNLNNKELLNYLL